MLASDKFRSMHIIVSLLSLLTMAIYAHSSSDRISAIPYANTGDFVASDGTVVVERSDDSFTVVWQNREPRTFRTTAPPPFKTGDRISFLLLLEEDGHFRLSESHVWEASKNWLIKSSLSSIPLIAVIVLLFRSYHFSMKRFLFLRRVQKNA